jgi:hypothetical protein
MPPPLAVDWDAIQAHAMIHGLSAAARDFGIECAAVRQRSKRYGWLIKARTPPEPLSLPVTMRPTVPVTGVTSAVEAMQTAMQRLSRTSKIRLAQAVHHGAKHAAKLKGDKVLEQAGNLKSLAATGDTVHGWSDERKSQTAGAQTFRLDLRISGGVGPEPVTLDIPVEQTALTMPEPDSTE